MTSPAPSGEYEHGLLEGGKCPECEARARLVHTKPRRAYMQPLIAVILVLLVVLLLSGYRLIPEQTCARRTAPEHQHQHDNAHNHAQAGSPLFAHTQHDPNANKPVKHDHPRPPPQKNIHYRYTCGNSIEEAKAKGCTWDPLAVQWLPPQCTRAMTQEYLDAAPHGKWMFKTRDPITGRPVDTVYEVSTMIGNLTYISTEYEHLAHCAYLLLRGSAARRDSTPMDALSMDFGHQKHCAEMLLERATFSPTSQRFYSDGDVGFGKC